MTKLIDDLPSEELFDRSKLFKFIHFELGNKCNLACPMCPRVDLLKKNYIDNKYDITPENFKKIIDPILYNCKHFYFSGNYSDPVMNDHLFDIINYSFTNPKISVQIGTNGSLRNTKYWSALGKKFKDRQDETGNVSTLLFAIDGLEDTNHIYRVNSKWNKIIDNVKAFVDAGGVADWKYVIFGHNEHQVEEANKLSKKLGFRTFITVVSSRFVDDESNVFIDELNNGAKKSDKNATVTRSTGKYDVNNYISKPGEIKCDAKVKNGLFITDRGLITPCCWLGNDLGYSNEAFGIHPDDKGMKLLMDMYPNWKTELNAIDNNILDVMEHPFWDTLQLLWDIKQPKMCDRQCGRMLDDFKDVTRH